MVNYYDLLGVPRQAELPVIKAAYKRLALQYHPDRNPDNAPAEEHFKLINEAYQTLSDPQKKLIYDLKLEGNYHRQYTAQTSQHTYRPNYVRNYYRQTRYAARPTYTSTQVRRAYMLTILTFFGLFMLVALLNDPIDRQGARTHYAEAMRRAANNELYPAIAELTAALSLDKTYAEAYQRRGELQLVSGEGYKLAYADFNNAIKHAKPPTAEMHFYRALCAYKTGRYQQALTDSRQAITDNELKGSALLLQGSVQRILGDFTSACANWQQAQASGLITASDSLRLYCGQAPQAAE